MTNVAPIRADAADPKASARDYLEGFTAPNGTKPFALIWSHEAADDLVSQARSLLTMLGKGFRDPEGEAAGLRPQLVADALEGVESLLAVSELCRNLAKGE